MYNYRLVLRGIKTMPLRIEKQQVNALVVANWLKTVPLITKVFYAGMEDHPDYDIHASQSTGSFIIYLTYY